MRLFLKQHSNRTKQAAGIQTTHIKHLASPPVKSDGLHGLQQELLGYVLQRPHSI